MDVALTAEGLAAIVGELVAVRDYEGAEEILTSAIGGGSPSLIAFAHLQYARVYRAWNKLGSAVDHLHRAAEVTDVEPFLKLQIASELASVKEARAQQRP